MESFNDAFTSQYSRRRILGRAAALSAGAFAFGLVGTFGLKRAAASGLEELATGVAALPAVDGAISWRLVRDLAPAPGDGDFLERALGFVFADEGGMVLVSDGENVRAVAKAKAVFIPEGILQRQESAGDPVHYLRFGLVAPAESAYTAGGELIYGGKPGFSAATGARKITLFKGKLAPGESVDLPQSLVMLVYARHGAIAVNPDGVDDDVFSIVAGEAVETRLADSPPDHWVVSQRGAKAAEFLVAVIGPDIGAHDGGVDESGGSLNLFVVDAPEGMDTSNLDLSACFASETGSYNLIGPGVSEESDGELPYHVIDESDHVEFGRYRVTGLPGGMYELLDANGRTPYVDYVITNEDGIVSEYNQAVFNVPDGGGEVVRYVVNFAQSGGDDGEVATSGGSITAQFFSCPNGNASHSDCSSGYETVDFLTLAGDDNGVLTTKAAMVESQGGWAWQDLPLGSYRIAAAYNVNISSAGDDSAFEHLSSSRDAGSWYRVTLTADNPDLVLQVRQIDG